VPNYQIIIYRLGNKYVTVMLFVFTFNKMNYNDINDSTSYGCEWFDIFFLGCNQLNNIINHNI